MKGKPLILNEKPNVVRVKPKIDFSFHVKNSFTPSNHHKQSGFKKQTLAELVDEKLVKLLELPKFEHPPKKTMAELEKQIDFNSQPVRIKVNRNHTRAMLEKAKLRSQMNLLSV